MTYDPAPKVRLRCGKRGCGRVLAEIYAASDHDAAIASAKATATTDSERLARVRRIHVPPDDWSGTVRIQPCSKHDKPRRQFTQEAVARAQAGYEDIRPVWTFHDVKWSEIATLYRRATGDRPVDDVLN